MQYQHRNTGGGVAGAAGKVAFKSTREAEHRQVEQYRSLSLSERTLESRTRTTTTAKVDAAATKTRKIVQKRIQFFFF